MIIQLEFNESSYQVNLGKPIDISIPLGQVKCFYAPDWKKEPVVAHAGQKLIPIHCIPGVSLRPEISEPPPSTHAA